MRIMIDSNVDSIAIELLDTSHDLIKISMSDMPEMPYDTEERSELVTEWLYSKSVDNDIDVVVVQDVEVASRLNAQGMPSVSLM